MLCQLQLPEGGGRPIPQPGLQPGSVVGSGIRAASFTQQIPAGCAVCHLVLMPQLLCKAGQGHHPCGSAWDVPWGPLLQPRKGSSTSQPHSRCVQFSPRGLDTSQHHSESVRAVRKAGGTAPFQQGLVSAQSRVLSPYNVHVCCVEERMRKVLFPSPP